MSKKKKSSAKKTAAKKKHDNSAAKKAPPKGAAIVKKTAFKPSVKKNKKTTLSGALAKNALRKSAANKDSNSYGMLRLVLVLFVITLITSALLGLVYYITSDRIEEHIAQKRVEAMRAVLPADGYEDVPYTGGDPLVTCVNMALSAGEQSGWVVEVAPSGFGGIISMEIGIDIESKVTGISIISMQETSGLGTNAYNESFRNQYAGSAGPFALSKDGGSIEALTGATVTSRAVTKGVNSALEAVSSFSKED